MGAVVAATALRRIGEMDLALLELEVPLAATGFEPAPRDAFAGSAAFALEYPAADNAAPAWPVLRVGFIGRRTLGIELPPGPRGGPVLDESARLVGLALADRAGADRLVPVSLLETGLGAAPAAPTRRLSLEEIYERALAATVQVLAAPR